jgi:hypothetical protein
MPTDWVVVMVSSSCKFAVDTFSVLEPKLDATKDPEGENTASPWDDPPGSALPMVSPVKAEEPSALQIRMMDISSFRAMQALSVPPAKKRERKEPPELKDWMHACSLIFHTVISPFDPPAANRLESVREKDNVLEESLLPTRILSACLGVRVGLSL